MAEKCRIKLNLVTKEAEIGGSEEFVKTYYKKIQGLLAEPSMERRRKLKVIESAPEKIGRQKKEPEEKRITNVGAVLAIVQASAKGISTAEIKEKTGLTGRQIWGIVEHAKKQGKITKVKRGLYVAVEIQ